MRYTPRLCQLKELSNPIQDEHFGTAHRWGGSKKSPFPKICHRYPTMIKLGTVIPYPKKIKNMFE